MDIFDFRNALITDYAEYVSSFITIRDPRIDTKVRDSFADGLLWPDPLVQLNPSFEPGGLVEELVSKGTLHPECDRIFRVEKECGKPGRPHAVYKNITQYSFVPHHVIDDRSMSEPYLKNRPRRDQSRRFVKPIFNFTETS